MAAPAVRSAVTCTSGTGWPPAVTDLNARGWRRKSWINKRGTESGGGSWDKGNLYRLLTNIIYTGRVQYEGAIYPGEHPAIVEETLWEKTQALLHRNAKEGGVRVRNKHGALLKGLLHCPHCNHAMTHSWTKKRDGRCYRYYVCVQAIKTGYDSCPSGSLPASEIEKFVVERIRAIGRDPALTAEILRQTWERTPSGKERVEPEELRAALAQFSPAWDCLVSHEQERLLKLLIERISYDGQAGTIAITFRPTGIKTLGADLQQSNAA